MVAVAIPSSAEEKRILPTSLPIPSTSQIPRTVGVALSVETSPVFVATEGSYELRQGVTHVLLKGNEPLEATIRATQQGIEIGQRVYPVDQLILKVPSGWVRVNKRKYLDQIRIVKDSEKSLTIINDVDLEEYLKGVLPLEVHYDWPLEALKAQAVISRTFALFKAIEKEKHHFSVRDTVESQVYGGALFHKPNTDAAVDATRGEILTFQGQIFPSYFHASCGGETAKADLVWPVQPNPVLYGVKCLFCKETKYWKWAFNISLKEIEHLMQKKGYPAKNLRRIAFLKQDPSGRAVKVKFFYERSQLTLPASDLRTLLGYDRLKSLKVEVEVRKGRAYFRGFGWGHGIGFCQWGSRRQAELGKTYKQILEYYFPGSEIKKV